MIRRWPKPDLLGDGRGWDRTRLLKRDRNPHDFRSAEVLGWGAGYGGTVRPDSVIGNQDGSKAVCVWEADSLDSIRNFVDPATEGIAMNEYFQANEQYSTGLPAQASAAS